MEATILMTARRMTTTLAPRPSRVKRRRGRSAFTIIELLIAVIIIGILVSLIIPILAKRADDARLAAVRSDLDAIVTAEQHAGIDTGHYYRLYALDDVTGTEPSGNTPLPPNDPNDVYDAFVDERLRTDTSVPANIFINTTDGTLEAGSIIFPKAVTNGGLEIKTFNWRGPYLNYVKKTGPAPRIPLDDYPAGLPIDPYGTPYMLFTRLGFIREKNDPGSNTGGGVLVFPTFNFGTNTAYPVQIFDRPTIVSFGPNGQPGDGSGTTTGEGAIGGGDDIIRQF